MQNFQDKWVVHLPWAKFVVDNKGNVHQVCCVIYSKVEGKEKHLVLKFDNLLKHAKHHEFKVVGPKVEVSFLYFNGKCQHAQNE